MPTNSFSLLVFVTQSFIGRTIFHTPVGSGEEMGGVLFCLLEVVLLLRLSAYPL